MLTDAELLELHKECLHLHGEDAAQEAIALLLEVLRDPRGWTLRMADRVAGREKNRRQGRPTHRPHISVEGLEGGGDRSDMCPSQPPDQLARLEALEDIELAPPGLVGDATGEHPLRTRQSREQQRKVFRRRLTRRDGHKP